MKEMKKIAVLLGTRDIVIKTINEGERFNFDRLNPTGIGPHQKSLLVHISATNKTMNNFNKLKAEIIRDNVFKKVLVERSHSYIVLANPKRLKKYFQSKKEAYRGLLDFSVYFERKQEVN